jgi:hypothetical protein
MKRPFLVFGFVVAAGALACSLSVNVPQADTGDVQVLTIDEPLPAEGTVVEVEINLGGGTLDLAGGASGLAEGSIRFNVEDWRPRVSRSEASLVIEQGDPDTALSFGDDVVNDWSLRLGNVPMELTIQAGAYSGLMDLSGLPLRRLTVNDGASDARLSFSSPNPEEMQSLAYRTGASTVSLTGLGYANFADMTFGGGAGTYTLDFGGELRRDATVNIETGVSSVRIEVPEGTAAVVVVDGALNNVEAIGGWSQEGDTYRLAGLGPTLRIFVDMGVGSLTLVEE